jgi:alkylated DNA repair protein (DNA oxidative demethylase)
LSGSNSCHNFKVASLSTWLRIGKGGTTEYSSANLFDDEPIGEATERIAQGAQLLRGFARAMAPELVSAVNNVTKSAPFRHMAVRGGHKMSVAMTNCGPLGWTSDENGYRYQAVDPMTGCPWPAMPDIFRKLAVDAAAQAGFHGFDSDACLVNRYELGAQMGLHQDKDERDFSSPIVSVSLGLPAVFLFGGVRRSERPRGFLLENGDVVVWGGPARLVYHGVAKLADGDHPITGRSRINLTFRRAG